MRNRFIIKYKQLLVLYVYVILLLTVYLSGSISVSIVNDNDISKKISLLLLLFFLPYEIIVILKTKYRKKMSFPLFFSALFLLINYLNYAFSISSLLMRILWIIGFLSIYLFIYDKNISYEHIFANLIFIISVVTLAFFVFIEILKIDLPYTVVNNVGIPYRRYFGLFYNTNYYLREYFGFQFHRLLGIFWEPGVYQVFLNFGLFYLLFCESKIHKVKIIVIIVNVALTLSTTGIMASVAMLAVRFYSESHWRKYRVIIFVPLALLTLVIMMEIWNQKITHETASYLARMSDLIIGFQIFLRNPLLGTGYDNTDIFLSIQNMGRGNSNGLITWLYTMGVVGIIPTNFPFIYNIVKQHNKEEKRKRIIFYFLFVIMNMTEPLYFAAIMWMIVAKQYSTMIYERNTLFFSDRTRKRWLNINHMDNNRYISNL